MMEYNIYELINELVKGWNVICHLINEWISLRKEYNIFMNGLV